MTIYRFIEHAHTMRHGGQLVVEAPFGYGPIKRRHHSLRVTEAAWGKLWGFRIKHPDSTRTAKARRLAVERRQFRREATRCA